MRWAAGLLAVVGLWLAGSLSTRAAPPPKESGQTARLIAELGSKNFRDRESATQALGRLGTRVLDALRRAAQGSDPEIRRRAALLVQKIEQQLERDRLLAPRRLRLAYENVSVTEAINDLARRTGYPIVPGDRSRLADRRLTMDTGETTFWEAFDQLCRKAGLVERRAQPVRGQQDRVINDGRGNQIIIVEQAYSNRARPPEHPLVLVEGTPESLPTWHAGGVRIRALPPNAPHPGVQKTSHQTYVLLEAMPEPAIKWHGVVDVQVERAVDDQGQILDQALANNPADGLDLELGLNALPFVEVDGEFVGSDPHQIEVRLRRGKEPSRLLRELRGSVAGRVETRETLVAIEDLAKAVDKSFHVSDGSTLHLAEFRRDDEGQGRLRIQLETPRMRGGRGAAQVIRGNRRIIFLNRGDTMTTGGGDWSLVDAGGRKVPMVAVSQRVMGGINGLSQETSFTFHAKDVKSPLKLLYSGSRTVTVEIPFTLKDVPLP
jgi:hypothetical protein